MPKGGCTAKRGRETSSGCSDPLSTGSKRGHPFCPPSLCKWRTLNKATSTVAVSQRAQSQPCCFCCKRELSMKLQISPRGSHFLPLGRGGCLSPQPTAVGLTRGALQPEANHPSPTGSLLNPRCGQPRSTGSDKSYNDRKQHLRKLVPWHWDSCGQWQVPGKSSYHQRGSWPSPVTTRLSLSCCPDCSMHLKIPRKIGICPFHTERN